MGKSSVCEIPAAGCGNRRIFAGGLTFASYSPTLGTMGDDRSKNALLIAASLIAAVRLAREEIKPTPRVLSAVSDSVRLAQLVLACIERNPGN